MAEAKKTTARKSTATPKRTANAKTNQDRPVRPRFVVIGENLHYSPDQDREIVIVVDPPWSQIEPIITGSDPDAPQGEVFADILEIIYGDDATKAEIMDLRTSEFFELAYEWMNQFQKLMGLDDEDDKGE